MSEKNKVRKKTQKLLILAIAAGDYFSFLLSFYAALFIWQFINPELNIREYDFLPFIIPIFNLLFLLNGLYKDIYLNRVIEFRDIAQSIFLSFIILLSLTFYLRNANEFSRGSSFLALVFSLILAQNMRFFIRKILYNIHLGYKEVVIFGDGEETQKITIYLRDHYDLGYRPVLWVGENAEPVRHDILASNFDNFEKNLYPSMKNRELTAVVNSQKMEKEHLKKLQSADRFKFSNIILLNEDFLSLSIWSEPVDLGGVIGIEVPQTYLSQSQKMTKRALDLSISLITMPFLLILSLFLSLAIKLDSPGPVFFRQKRIGQEGKIFEIYKFRTMYRDAETRLAKILASDTSLRKEWDETMKLKNDPRITKMGIFLRKTSLDELPQIINVLLGNMSLVGPRPIIPPEAIKYGENIEFYKHVKPGITGIWQISGRNEIEYAMRVQIDISYFRNWSVWYDLYILMRTPVAVLLEIGAY